MGHHQLDALDEQILRLIAGNARIPFLEVARACNVSGAAIHQRIQKLTNLGILKGSEYVIDPEKIGYETCAYIGIYLNFIHSRNNLSHTQACQKTILKKFHGLFLLAI